MIVMDDVLLHTDRMFWLRVEKAIDGEEWRFRVIASTDSLDRDGEVIDPAAIRKLKEVERVPYCVAESHNEAMLSPVTQVGWFHPDPSTPDNIYAGEVVLFKDSHLAQDYWVVLRNNPTDQKCSISGWMKASTRSGRPTRILDMTIDHILACRAAAAANPDTAVELDMHKAVFKAASQHVRNIGEVTDVEEFAMWDETDEAAALLAEAELEAAADIEKADIEVSNRPWDVTGYAKRLPAACFLYVPDKKKRSTWKFPVFEGANPDEDGNFRDRGPLNWHALRNAAARIIAIRNRLRSGGHFATMTNAEAEALVREVVPKIIALYKRIGKPVPEALEKTAEGDTVMSRLTDALRAIFSKSDSSAGEQAAPSEEQSVEAPAGVAVSKAEDTAAAAGKADDASAEETVAATAADGTVPSVAEDLQNEVEKTDATGEESGAGESAIEALRQDVERLRASLDKLVETLSGAPEKSAAEDAAAKTSEAPSEQPAEAGQNAELTAAIAEVVAQLVQPIADEVATLREQVSKVLERRGLSLQVGKAAAEAARDASIGTLVPAEGGLEELKRAITEVARGGV